jgi:hypothetical protein
MSNELSGGNKNALDALLYCIKHGVMISGEVAKWLAHENEELIVDEGYDDFDNAARWSIGKYYIIVIDDDAYRFWEEVGLTEMQPNEWYDQIFEPVIQRTVSVAQWQTVEDIEIYENLKRV